MIVPSIDLSGGQAVQLIGGKEKALEAGDPRPIAERFRLAGEIAVIDLDAALGQGSNAELIEKLIQIAPCRVGGGIRDVDTAIRWLDAGASKIILGTKAVPEVLEQLPADRVIAALDADRGEVVVEGWQTPTGRTIEERMEELRRLVGGFLVTFVESEGRLQGIDLDRVDKLARLVGDDASLTVAGGVTTEEDLARIDRLGADAQVGMALYTNKLPLAKAISAPLGGSSDRWPTVVTDDRDTLLGFGWSTEQTLEEAVDRQSAVLVGVSDAPGQLVRIEPDDQRTALRFMVRDSDLENTSWNQFSRTLNLDSLLQRLQERKHSAPKGSYTQRLLSDPELLRAKLLEEAEELSRAQGRVEASWEAADLIYFTFVALVRADASLFDVQDQLERRSKKVTRRAGDAK